MAEGTIDYGIAADEWGRGITAKVGAGGTDGERLKPIRLSSFANAFCIGPRGVCLRAANVCPQADTALSKGRVEIPLTLSDAPIIIGIITNSNVVRVNLLASALQSP